MSPYVAVQTQVRASLQRQTTSRDLLNLTRRIHHTAELLDLSADGMATAIRQGRLREAQMRCDAAEQALREICAVMQTLADTVRAAREARRAAA